MPKEQVSQIMKKRASSRGKNKKAKVPTPADTGSVEMAVAHTQAWLTGFAQGLNLNPGPLLRKVGARLAE
jgi:hypothetical protein